MYFFYNLQVSVCDYSKLHGSAVGTEIWEGQKICQKITNASNGEVRILYIDCRKVLIFLA